MALRACVDAGEQAGTFCVAVIAFGFDKAKRANREWEEALNGRTFHMTDLHNRQGDFKGINDVEVDAIMKSVVQIIRKYAQYAVAISCDTKVIAPYLPRAASRGPDMDHMLAALKSTYGLMCHLAMYAIGRRANENKNRRQISYIFELGDNGQRGFKCYLDYLGNEKHHDLLLDGYSIDRSMVTDKEKLEGVFHSADLIAWEWARHVNRSKAGRPMRKSLSALTGKNIAESDKYGMTLEVGRQFFLRHFSPDYFVPATVCFSEMLLAESMEQFEEAVERYKLIHPETNL